ncbi:hypothetical protein GGI42DRAFT_352293 [Trichoderma sp. SZMC 28013]
MDDDDEYRGPTIEVVGYDYPWDPRHRRQINIDLGPIVSAQAESGRDILIIVYEPMEGNDFVSIPWQLLDGWFYRLGNSYIINLLVQDGTDDDDFEGFYGSSACFIFTTNPLSITPLEY